MPMVTLRRNMEPTIVKKLPYDFPAVHGYTLHIFCVRRNAFTMQAVFPGRGPHTMQTLGKGVHSVAPRGGTSFLQALFLAGVLLWPPWAGCHWGLNRIASPGGRVAFFVINGVDLPLTFPAAGTGRLTLPPFFVVYTVNQAVNFPPAGHGGRRVTSVVAPCVFFWGGTLQPPPQPWQRIRQGACFVSTLRLALPSPVMTPATSAAKTATNAARAFEMRKAGGSPPAFPFSPQNAAMA